MFDEFDHNELLALIEGELDEPRASELRRELATQPEALMQIEAMIADRRSMRSMSQPQMPRDLLSELETHLARPMLVGQSSRQSNTIKPGHYRRTHRRRRLPAALAVAAMIALFVFAGWWAMSSGLFEQGHSSSEMIAQNDQPTVDNPSPTTTASSNTAPDDALADDASVHHYMPVPFGDDRRATADSDSTNRQPSTETPRQLPFALVVVANADSQTGNNARSELESTLQTVLKRRDGMTALVRNFSFAEAREIEKRYYAKRNRRGSDNEPDRASAGGG